METPLDDRNYLAHKMRELEDRMDVVDKTSAMTFQELVVISDLIKGDDTKGIIGLRNEVEALKKDIAEIKDLINDIKKIFKGMSLLTRGLFWLITTISAIFIFFSDHLKNYWHYLIKPN